MELTLKTKLLGLETGGKPIVVLNKSDAEELGIRSCSRVEVCFKKKRLIAITNISAKLIEEGAIGVSEEVKSELGLRSGDEVRVEVAEFPKSLRYIKAKLEGKKLGYEEFYEIVKDVVEGRLSEGEIASFVCALETRGIDLDEAASLSLAMVETGKKIEFKGKKKIVDKHSIGGVPGDKTSLVLVPIIASLGLTIPKTSSRAITSAAGTADRAECLMPVSLEIEEMLRVVKKTNGCIAWGGTLHLAPADDIFIQVEYPLAIDPLLFPSIMSKKKAVGSKYLVIDIPCGRGAKIKTIGDADKLAKDFIELGKRLGIDVRCAVTHGEEPVGYCVGPALEAREALSVLMRRLHVEDLLDKVTDIVAILLGMVGMKYGKQRAIKAISSGKAERKLREIIAEQGGNPKIKPEDIPVGEEKLDVLAKSKGFVLWISNPAIISIARAAGAPKDKGAGIVLHKKLGEPVREGEKILTVYAEKSEKLERAKKVLEETPPMGIGKRREMLIHEIREKPLHRKTFILER